MAITAGTLFGRVRSLLDDDNSAVYNEADDLVPAANLAINYITAVFSAAFEQKSIQPEVLSELIDVLIYNPSLSGGNKTARVNLDTQVATTSEVFNDVVWRILGVDPKPEVDGTTDQLLDYTQYRFAKRLTLEEWDYSLEDPFAPGSVWNTDQQAPTDFRRVCYTGPGNFFGTGVPYLLLRPGSFFSDTSDRVAVWVLRKHDTIVDNTTELKFPVSVHNLLVQKILYYVGHQHMSDKYLQVTDKEVKELITLLN